MTSSPSRSVLPQSYRDGVFIKELDELKKLLQQTNVEMKACMSRCCGKPQRTESPPAPSGGENSNELCGDVSDNDDDELLNDVRLEAGHVSQIIEGKAYQASSSLAKKEEDPAVKDLIDRLEKAVADNHRNLVTSIHKIQEDAAKQRKRKHTELMNVIQHRSSTT